MATANPLRGVRKPGTVGVPFPGPRVVVVDDSDAALPPGDTGEAVIVGPNVMRGYLGRAEQTARTLRGGRLRTGDVGRFDDDG